MISPDRALAAAIHAALMADADVRASLGDPARIHDDHPPDTVFPYATFARFESRPLDASEAPALDHAIGLHVWSRHGGRAEALDALGALRRALHDKPLAIAGRRLVLMLVIFTDAFRAGDGITTQGLLRLRAITEAA